MMIIASINFLKTLKTCEYFFFLILFFVIVISASSIAIFDITKEIANNKAETRFFLIGFYLSYQIFLKAVYSFFLIH